MMSASSHMTDRGPVDEDQPTQDTLPMQITLKLHPDGYYYLPSSFLEKISIRVPQTLSRTGFAVGLISSGANTIIGSCPGRDIPNLSPTSDMRQLDHGFNIAKIAMSLLAKDKGREYNSSILYYIEKSTGEKISNLGAAVEITKLVKQLISYQRNRDFLDTVVSEDPFYQIILEDVISAQLVIFELMRKVLKDNFFNREDFLKQERRKHNICKYMFEKLKIPNSMLKCYKTYSQYFFPQKVEKGLFLLKEEMTDDVLLWRYHIVLTRSKHIIELVKKLDLKEGHHYLMIPNNSWRYNLYRAIQKDFKFCYRPKRDDYFEIDSFIYQCIEATFGIVQFHADVKDFWESNISGFFLKYKNWEINHPKERTNFRKFAVELLTDSKVEHKFNENFTSKEWIRKQLIDKRSVIGNLLEEIFILVEQEEKKRLDKSLENRRQRKKLKSKIKRKNSLNKKRVNSLNRDMMGLDLSAPHIEAFHKALNPPKEYKIYERDLPLVELSEPALKVLKMKMVENHPKIKKIVSKYFFSFSSAEIQKEAAILLYEHLCSQRFSLALKRKIEPIKNRHEFFFRFIFEVH